MKIATSLSVIISAAVVSFSYNSPAQTALETKLLSAMQAQGFDHVIDFGPYNESCPGKSFCQMPAGTIKQMPNVDVAVIQLDANGQMVDRANVMLSRDYTNGLIVPLNTNSGASQVRFIKWDIARNDGGTFSSSNGKQLSTKGWTNNPDLTTNDFIVQGRESAPYFFMSPYPASGFKIMIGFKVMRMVDAGAITLDTLYTPTKKSATKSVRDWMTAMITYSDNASAQAMVKLIWDNNQMAAMNQEFANLGLGTLQVNGTDPTTGGYWAPGQIDMTAYDAARLYWIIEGGTGTFWIGANGQAVTAALLSDSSRTFLKGLLADQGFNDTLTSANMCGNPNAKPGIPSAVPSNWVDATNGTVTVDGYAYGEDVRSCNSAAQVAFAHKTGFTFNYCSDSGIVNSLPGQQYRHYIVVYLSNLGYRYADEEFANATGLPYYFVNPVPYTERAATLGKAIDDALKQ